jgi:chemotaxis signal transduction protein
VENGSKQYLAFRVARQDLALDSSVVRAIVPIEEMTPITSTRPGVIGVVSLTGSTVVVVDLRVRLNLTAASHGAQRRIVVVQTAGGHLAGFVADRVADVIRYRARDLKNGVLRGIGRPRRVVDVDRVVDEDDLVRLWSVVE